ncbi:MAG: ABC transporter substrate-binding protein [Deltaproteobacteria bacterium]|nr:ABC transporter substrate-binding protein [Deltaproteobacteria bacterium]
MKKIIPVLVVLLIGMPSLAQSAQPLDALRGPIDSIISVLNDPQYQDSAKRDVEREKIWEIIFKLFDFTEMAKRTLARNWRGFTPQERKEFTQVFAEFLGNTYIDKIQKDYQEEKVVYVKEEMVTDSKALVKTKIVRETLEIPVNYGMKLRDGVWKVYDVNIEGVSLVKNYRTQFNKILLSKSASHLIERLKKKIEQQKEGNAVSDQAGLEALPRPHC